MKKLLVSLLCVMMVFCMMPTMAFAGNQNPCELTPCTHAAAIGEIHFDTFDEAVSAASVGDEIKILAEGTYAVPSGKDVVITGAVDGVVFDNIGACGMNGANVTFNNVTFDYYPNTNYTGLQHSGNLTYNDCTFNGQVFLYGESETFNKCTFNQNSADAYNVWTYGAKKVAFNDCTFNSVGKSVLIYAESTEIFNDVTVSGCDFIASAPVEGKAAIEMDSSLTAGINLTIAGETTATGFGSGNVSNNSLWNNKKGAEDENNDIKVTVDGETVLKSTFVAKIGETKYVDLHEAMTAAKSGETVELIDDVNLDGTEWEPVSFAGKFNGNGYAIKNLTIDKPGVSNTGFIKSLNGTFENVTFTNPSVTGGEGTAVLAGRAGGGAALAKNITVNGTIKVETTHSGYARAGVIVGGWAYGNYENITVDGGDKEVSYVKHTGGGDGRYVAGIVGHADDVDSYVNCVVKNITISSTNGGWLCGGIAGPGPSDGLASGCTVENININADYSGGMFGWYYGNGTIENSTIKDVTFTGGATKNGAIGGYQNNTSANVSNITIENVKNVNGEPIFAPVAKIGNEQYATLQSALDAAAAGSGNVTVEILDDIDLTGEDWNPVTVSGPGFPVVTVNGNNHTITGLNDMLFAGTWAGGSGLIINDLTISNSNIVNDKDDSKGTVGVGAFIGFPQASATITLNNCHLKDSTVEGGHWTGGLIGYAAGYAGNDGPVFMNLTIKDCSVTGSKIIGEGSVGGVIGHATGNAWTQVDIINTTVSDNTITSTGSSDNKAGSVMGTIGAAGQPATANGETKTGGIAVSAITFENTVTSHGTKITTIYGRQGTSTGDLKVNGGTYEAYPIEKNVAYAAPAEGFKIEANGDGTYGVVAKVPAALSTDIGTKTFKAGGDWVEFTFTTTANDYANLDVYGGSDFGVQYEDKIAGLEYKAGDQWIDMKGKNFGDANGFPMADATSTFRVKFTEDAAGSYTFTASMRKIADDSVVCELVVPFTVQAKAAPAPQAPSGGGYVSIEKPEITADAGASTELGFLGTTLKITVKEGFELVDVTVNGVSKGAVAELKGLKTGDKVVVTTKAIGAEDPAEEETEEVQLVARSAMGKAKGKKAVKLYWFAEDGSELNFDGYEIFRSVKRTTGYGKKPIFTTKREVYWNTDIEVGEKYYYRVRAYNVVDGVKEYSDWSLKAWRTVK